MLKHKKFLSLLLVLPIFSVFSCSKVKEEYQIHQYEETAEFINHLNVTGTLKKTTYEAKDNETLNLAGLTISINNEDATSKRINERDKIEDLLKLGSFFVCSKKDIPTHSFIGSDYKATTNVESSDFTFYIATAVQVDQTYEIYVSQGFKVTIKNSNAIKPWVWYVVTGVVIFGVIGMVMLTRHYKAKKEGKI